MGEADISRCSEALTCSLLIRYAVHRLPGLGQRMQFAQLKRRDFIKLIGGAAAVALPGASSHAQEHQNKIYRIGFLRAGPPPKTWVGALQRGLRERGYVDGQNVVIEFRFTQGGIDQLPQLAEDLLRLNIDVLLASSSPSAVAAKKATTSIPIVFVNVFDPVEIELVPSLARPEGNMTGLAATSPEVAGNAAKDRMQPSRRS